MALANQYTYSCFLSPIILPGKGGRYKCHITLRFKIVYFHLDAIPVQEILGEVGPGTAAAGAISDSSWASVPGVASPVHQHGQLKLEPPFSSPQTVFSVHTAYSSLRRNKTQVTSRVRILYQGPRHVRRPSLSLLLRSRYRPGCK